MIRSLSFVAVPVIVTLLAVFSIRLMFDTLLEYQEIDEPQWTIWVVILPMVLCNMLTVFWAAKAWFLFFSAP